MSNELDEKIAQHFDESHAEIQQNNENIEELTFETCDKKIGNVIVCGKCGNTIARIE